MSEEQKEQKQESQEDLIQKMNETYGDQGEDWDGVKCKFKNDSGQKEQKTFVVRAPTNNEYKDFVNKVEHRQNNQKAINPLQKEIVDKCLVGDKEVQQKFQEAARNKPAIVNSLADKIVNMMNEGIEDLKE